MAAENEGDRRAAERIIALAARPPPPWLRSMVADVATQATALRRRLRPGLIRRLFAPTAASFAAEDRAAALAQCLAEVERPLREEAERLRGGAAILVREARPAARLAARTLLETVAAHDALRDAMTGWLVAHKEGKNLVAATKSLATVAAMLAENGFADEDAEA
jgi:hypothetical protein